MKSEVKSWDDEQGRHILVGLIDEDADRYTRVKKLIPKDASLGLILQEVQTLLDVNLNDQHLGKGIPVY